MGLFKIEAIEPLSLICFFDLPAARYLFSTAKKGNPKMPPLKCRGG